MTSEQKIGQASWDLRAPHAPEWFEQQVCKRGGDVAIRNGQQEILYADLDRRTAAVGLEIGRRGLRRGSLVGILAEDRVWLAISILGILKAGCGFVPLDARLPDERLRVMLEECEPALILVERFLQGRLEEAAGRRRMLCLEDCPDRGESAQSESGRWGGDDLCYIYFTSGSTGRPKGIAGRMKGIDHFIRWEIRRLGLEPGVRVSQLTRAGFDAYLRDLFVPLCVGGTMCIPEEDVIADGGRLLQWLERERVQVLHCVPTVLRQLLQESAAGALPDLRHALAAGEALLPADVRQWDRVMGDRAQLINLYGASETTMAKFAYVVRPEDQHSQRVPIGKPIEGAAALVMDEDGRACPTGATGEIHIRTPYRSLGYYGRPELTAEVFVPNPFTKDPEDLIHKTGDLGRVLKNGDFEYLGRRDKQVKIFGNRVELGEIENALAEQPGVRQAAVIVREGESGEPRLIGYVTGEVKGMRLREAIRSRLPGYMVPSAVVELAQMPLTVNGKVDQSRLPEPEGGQGGREAPRTAVEEILAGMWCEVLKRERVGMEEDFFETGGHSLSATQLMSRIRKALGVEMALKSLFVRPTIRGLAEEVEKGMGGNPAASGPELRRRERKGGLPLSFAQQRLWFIDQLEPGQGTYNMPVAMRLEGAVDAGALERAVSEIVRRHEVLRTRFEMCGDEPVQVIEPAAGVEMPAVDLRGLGEEERKRRAKELTQEEAARPFDLRKGPMLRVKLLRLGEEEHVLLATMHHVASDGWSLGLLRKEFAALYEAYAKGEESPLPPLAIQYADYALWQREWLKGEALEEQLRYWREQLAGMTALELPTDYARPAAPSHRGAVVPIDLGVETSKRLKALSRQEGVTLFMTLLAGFQALLGRWTGQLDVAVGTDIANRNWKETEDLIGLFVNQVVLRTDLSGNPSFRELLWRVRETTLEAYRHQDLPFERLVEDLQPQRTANRPPLFQVKLGLENIPTLERQSKFALQSKETMVSTPATVDIEIVMRNGPSISGTLKYDVALFREEMAAALADGFARLLEAVSIDPAVRIAEAHFQREHDVIADSFRAPLSALHTS